GKTRDPAELDGGEQAHERGSGHREQDDRGRPQHVRVYRQNAPAARDRARGAAPSSPDSAPGHGPGAARPARREKPPSLYSSERSGSSATSSEGGTVTTLSGVNSPGTTVMSTASSSDLRATRIVEPGSSDRPRTKSASGSSIRRWIARRSGRAPIAGS